MAALRGSPTGPTRQHQTRSDLRPRQPHPTKPNPATAPTAITTKTNPTTETPKTAAVIDESPGHVQFPDWQMEDPYSARLPLARSGEKSRRAPSVGELQMTGRRFARAPEAASRAGAPSTLLWPGPP